MRRTKTANGRTSPQQQVKLEAHVVKCAEGGRGIILCINCDKIVGKLRVVVCRIQLRLGILGDAYDLRPA